MRSTRLSLALCSCLIVPLACTKGGDKAPTAEQTSEDQPTLPGTNARANAAGANVFDTADLAKLIPSDAISAAAIASPERFFTLFGRDEIVAKLGPLYDDNIAEVREITGQDLLSLPGLKAFGIDPSQPVAMFLASVDPLGVGVVVGLSDRDAFLASVQKIAAADRQELDTQQQGDATIVCSKRDPDVCLLVTASHGYLLGTEGGSGLALAKQIAGLSPEQSLASNADFTRALAKLDGGRDGVYYLNLEPVLTPILLAAGEDNPRTALVRELLGPMEALIAGADFDQRSLNGQVLLQAKQPFLLASLLKNGSHLNPVVQAMGEDAIMLGTYNVDLEATWSLAGKAVAIGGQDLDEADAEILSLMGFGFKRDALPALSGELGIGIEADLDAWFGLRNQADQPDSEAMEAKFAEAVDGAFMIGLTDLDKGRALVEKVLARRELTGIVKRDDDRNQWSLTGPYGKTLLIRIASPPGATPYVVVATTQALLDRISEGKVAPAFSGQPSDSAYAEFIGQPDTAATYAGRQVLFGAGMWFGFSSFDGSKAMALHDVEAQPGSAKVKKARKQLAKVDAEITEIDRKRNADQAAIMRDIFAPWGATAAALKVTPDGLELRLGQFIDAPSWAELASGLVDTFKTMAAKSNEDAARLHELYDRRAELNEQLFELEQGTTP